MTQIFICECVS